MQAQFKEAFWIALATASWCLLQLRSTDAQGTWEQLLDNAGISSMHTAITHYDTAILLDRTNIGESDIKLSGGECRENEDELTLKRDCTAHSVMFDPTSKSVRALWVETDTWCSSGQFDADGKMIQTGGDFEGIKKIRTLAPCRRNGNCDWVETDDELSEGRWYATNQILPDGKMQIVVGGRRAFSYEFVPKRRNNEGVFDLQLLEDTNSASGDNMYPFVHLLPSGNLYIFANRDSIILNYKDDKVEKEFPTIPGEPRNYPSAGSSVMLPLTQANDYSVVEVLVCGGAQDGAFQNYGEELYPASKTCGRITVTDDDPEWAMEDMPIRRTMGDMLLLPNGEVLIINGAEKGAQGWGRASDPVLTPVKYATYNAEDRFQTLAAGDITRVYHSTANLLKDGRILLAGSNSHQYYTFSGEFPTELRIDAFSPPYLDAGYNDKRPAITDSPNAIGYGDTFEVTFTATEKVGDFELNLESSPFVTHSYAMGQRLLKLKVTEPVAAADEGSYTVEATAPPYAELAPPGYYMLWAVQDWIPGTAVWVKIA